LPLPFHHQKVDESGQVLAPGIAQDGNCARNDQIDHNAEYNSHHDVDWLHSHCSANHF
jgi:hypothetical protein